MSFKKGGRGWFWMAVVTTVVAAIVTAFTFVAEGKSQTAMRPGEITADVRTEEGIRQAVSFLGMREVTDRFSSEQQDRALDQCRAVNRRFGGTDEYVELIGFFEHMVSNGRPVWLACTYDAYWSPPAANWFCKVIVGSKLIRFNPYTVTCSFNRSV